MVPQVLRRACCARAAHHGVCLSCLAEFRNGRIKGRVKSKVTGNEISQKNWDEEEEEEEDTEEDVKGKKRMKSMMMRICVRSFYLTNSICAEFRGNTAKNTQHCSRPTKTLDVSESSSSYLACHNK